MTISAAVLQPTEGEVSPEARAASTTGDEAAYWKKPASHPTEAGWVTVRQAGKNTNDLFFKGWSSLLQKYGPFNLSTGAGGWKPDQDPYLKIVQMGGVGEFPTSQIKSLNWHRRPTRASFRSHHVIWAGIDALIQQGLTEQEAVLQTFPGLTEADLQNWTCEFCPNRNFQEESYLRRHEAVQHKEQVQARETRTAILSAVHAGKGTPGQAGEIPNTQIVDYMAQQLGEVAKQNSEVLQAMLLLLKQTTGVQAAPAETLSAAAIDMLDVNPSALRRDIEQELDSIPEPPRKRNPRDAFNESIN